MPSTTATHHPQVMRSQSPDARKIVWFVAARPDWFNAATAIATTPSPNMISTNVPRYSPRYSPQTVFLQAAPAPMRTCQTPLIPVASVVVSATSTSFLTPASARESADRRIVRGDALLRRLRRLSSGTVQVGD